MSPALLKQKLYSLTTVTIIVFGEKKGALQVKEKHPDRDIRGWQHHVVGVILLQEEGKLCGYILATSQDKRFGHKLVFQIDNDLKHTSKVSSILL